MNILIFLSLLSVLLTSVFWIIPTYAPPEQREIIKDWVGIGFSGLLLLFALVETRIQDPTLILPVVFYLFVLALCLSGVYWWIPTYVHPDEQNNATMWLFLTTSIAVSVSNAMAPAARVTLGGRRR